MDTEDKQVRVLVVSTRTSLAPLLEAARRINEARAASISVIIYYQHELDRDPGLLEELCSDAVEADIVLIDWRSGMSRALERLSECLSRSRARLVIPLVAGDPRVLRLARIGILRGFEPRMGSSDRIDLSRVWRFFSWLERSKLAKAAPGLRDARLWALAVRYWSEGDSWNIEQMLRMLLSKLGHGLSYEPPRRIVEPGKVYLPGKGVLGLREAQRLIKEPRVAILLYAGMHFDQTRVVAEALADALGRRGIGAYMVIGGGSEDLVGQTRLIEKALSGARIEALINLQWFRIEGGPYGGDYEEAINLLKRFDVPLIDGLIMYMSEVEEWRRRSQGLSPIEVLAGVALPEADGAIEPIPLAGLDETRAKNMVVLRDRVERRAERISSWVRLRGKKNSEKRVAIIIYNYPPGRDNLGSAAYLDVFRSIERLLAALGSEGYKVEQLSATELKRLFVEEGLFNAGKEPPRSCGIRVGAATYRKWFSELPRCLRDRVVAVWGSPPGELMVDENGLCIPGIVVGNVFIGVQPSRGVHEDQEKLYHDKDLPPHHQYVTFYLWLRRGFRADAVIHLGTHGTLELLPGKEVGLDECSFPDALIGDLPNIYVWHVTNSSEMIAAKRRSYAYIVTHLPPPPSEAGLSPGLEKLREMLDEYIEAKQLHPERARLLWEKLREEAKKLGFSPESPEELHEIIEDAEREAIPLGLHILGDKWGEEEIERYLVLYERRKPSGLHKVVAKALGYDYDRLLSDPGLREVLARVDRVVEDSIRRVMRGDKRGALSILPAKARRSAEKEIETLLDAVKRIRESDEIESVLHALRGGYVEPRVAGDPLRYHDVLPTGSNGYSFDPRLVPSEAAIELGWRLAEELLKRHVEKHGKWPETIGLVLWGFETAGTRGETVGLIFALLGVRLVRKGPWGYRLEPVPLKELGRPRVDVAISICGFFRDMFPHLIEMIDRAIRLVADLEEPLDSNYVRKHVIEMKARKHLDPYARIFGPKPGAYNTRLTELIETGAWVSQEELARTYLEDMGYIYTEKLHGVKDTEHVELLLSSAELAAQVRYSTEYDVVDLDHYYEFLGGLKTAAEKARGENIDAYWADTSSHRLRVTTLQEAIAYSSHTRILNPKWIEAMLRHGYDGVREVANRVTNLLGLAATTKSVPENIWHSIVNEYLGNKQRLRKMMQENPYAVRKMAEKLQEAALRGYWSPSEEEMKIISEILEELLQSHEPTEHESQGCTARTGQLAREQHHDVLGGEA